MGRMTPGRVAAAATGVALAVALPVASLDVGGADPRPADGGWTASWAAAMTPPGTQGPAAAGVHDATLRQRVQLSLGGHSLRLRLSHEYGARALRVGAVTVDAGAGAVPVTFGGRDDFALAGGVERVSDPVPLRIDAGADLMVDLYLPGDTGPLTQHPYAGATTAVAAGDLTGAPESAFMPLGTSRLLLSGVDVESDAGAVVALGDSLTDGLGAGAAEHAYPAVLADRMLGLPADERLAVVNAGISGNRLLADGNVAGVSATSRLESDVLSQPGARVVLLLEGINDILHTGGSLHPRSIRNAYERIAARAHEQGLAVVGATLTPYAGSRGYTAAGEDDRIELNDWIRTTGAFDAVVDLDAAVRDPELPRRLDPAFDAGDGLHLNAAGYAAMAAAFDLDELVRLAEG